MINKHFECMKVSSLEFLLAFLITITFEELRRVLLILFF